MFGFSNFEGNLPNSNLPIFFSLCWVLHCFKYIIQSVWLLRLRLVLNGSKVNLWIKYLWLRWNFFVRVCDFNYTFFLTKRHVNSGQHQLCHDYLKFEPHFTLRICLSVKNVPFTYLNLLSTNRTTRQFADELFECVWPFCRIGT